MGRSLPSSVSAVPSSADGALILSIDRLHFTTEESPQFIDITPDVSEVVKGKGPWSGTVVVHSLHTTAPLLINEAEPLLLDDFKRLLHHLCSDELDYRHDAHHEERKLAGDQERPNGSSHCRALLLPTSLTIPVVDGVVQLGRWQRTFLVELDTGRPREVLVQCLGMRSQP